MTSKQLRVALPFSLTISYSTSEYIHVEAVTDMTYRNYQLLGEELVAEWARHAPFRVNRLITALEAFVCGGPATRAAPLDPLDAEIEVYLTPPRHVLRAVPDAGALILVDHTKKIVRLVEVIEDYVEFDEQVWPDLVGRAHGALAAHEKR